jgi:hypothetical protein
VPVDDTPASGVWTPPSSGPLNTDRTPVHQRHCNYTRQHHISLPTHGTFAAHTRQITGASNTIAYI